MAGCSNYHEPAFSERERSTRERILTRGILRAIKRSDRNYFPKVFPGCDLRSEPKMGVEAQSLNTEFQSIAATVEQVS